MNNRQIVANFIEMAESQYRYFFMQKGTTLQDYLKFDFQQPVVFKPKDNYTELPEPLRHLIEETYHPG